LVDFSYQTFNPFRTLHWRFERVLEMVDQQPTPARATRADDKYVRGLRNFLLRYRRYNASGRQRLMMENPGLYTAWLLHERAEDEYETVFIIQARILARQSDKEVAREFSTLPSAIEWYEKLFFNVRDRFDAHDWILRKVLAPALTESRVRAEEQTPEGRLPRSPLAEPFFDSSLMLFAYFGGPLAVDFMLSGFRRDLRLQTNDDVGPWLNEYTMQAAKRRAAMAVGQFEVNKYNVMELFSFITSIMTIEKSADHEDQSRTAIESNIEKMLGQLSFSLGRQAEEMVEGTIIGELDQGAAELRDGELLLLQSGGEIETLDELREFKIPEPRKKEDDDDADTQQAG
jgi:hypothetical protein